MGESVVLSRDCDAIRVPEGERVTLSKGARVTITQSLGGNITVITDKGVMVSVAERDADALGKETPPALVLPPDASVEEQVQAQLRRCYDPEIPHNIVDLGLVYECRLVALEGGGRRAEIRMGLTAPGCGMGDWLKSDVRQKVLSVPGIKEASVDIVLDPPWTPGMMSENLRLYLNL